MCQVLVFFSLSYFDYFLLKIIPVKFHWSCWISCTYDEHYYKISVYNAHSFSISSLQALLLPNNCVNLYVRHSLPLLSKLKKYSTLKIIFLEIFNIVRIPFQDSILCKFFAIFKLWYISRQTVVLVFVANYSSIIIRHILMTDNTGCGLSKLTPWINA